MTAFNVDPPLVNLFWFLHPKVRADAMSHVMVTMYCGLRNHSEGVRQSDITVVVVIIIIIIIIIKCFITLFVILSIVAW
jgi:hypothetical protein